MIPMLSYRLLRALGKSPHMTNVYLTRLLAHRERTLSEIWEMLAIFRYVAFLVVIFVACAIFLVGFGALGALGLNAFVFSPLVFVILNALRGMIYAFHIARKVTTARIRQLDDLLGIAPQGKWGVYWQIVRNWHITSTSDGLFITACSIALISSACIISLFSPLAALPAVVWHIIDYIQAPIIGSLFGMYFTSGEKQHSFAVLYATASALICQLAPNALIFAAHVILSRLFSTHEAQLGYFVAFFSLIVAVALLREWLIHCLMQRVRHQLNAPLKELDRLLNLKASADRPLIEAQAKPHPRRSHKPAIINVHHIEMEP
jgi:hypothetical protein